MAAILNVMFYKKPTRKRAPHPPDITIGNQPSIIRTENKLSAKTMLVAVLLRYPVVFAFICINIDFAIFFFKGQFHVKGTQKVS